jgi:hypothetical protein
MGALTAKPDLLSRMLRPNDPRFSNELAAFILDLKFDDDELARMDALARKSNQGTLTADERAEYEWYVLLADLLSLMQIKAQASLQKQQPAA